MEIKRPFHPQNPETVESLKAQIRLLEDRCARLEILVGAEMLQKEKEREGTRSIIGDLVDKECISSEISLAQYSYSRLYNRIEFNDFNYINHCLYSTLSKDHDDRLHFTMQTKNLNFKNDLFAMAFATDDNQSHLFFIPTPIRYAGQQLLEGKVTLPQGIFLEDIRGIHIPNNKQIDMS